jgi:hypothetical protein
MRKVIVIALAMTVTAVAVPAAAYYWSAPTNDALGDTLRGYGFLPINPPSNLMNVGSLYYVDASLKGFTTICPAEKADIDNAMIKSPSWNMQENLQRNGRLATGVNVDLGTVIKGDLDDNYMQKVHSSLTDVILEELPLGANWLIFTKLMNKSECNRVAMEVISAGGYVC